MKLKTRKEDGDVAVLEMKGKVMGGPDFTLFNDELHQLVDEGIKKFVFDLSGVTWMNSSGLGILISGLTTIRNNGGELRLASITKKIESLFMITKLVTIFDTRDSVEEAIKSFN